MPRFQAKASRLGLAFALLLLAGACVTVNIYFPAAEVERAAERIVEDVYATGGSGSQEGGTPQSGGSSALEVFLASLRFLGPATAHAQDAVGVSNAAIRNLKEQIAQNHGQLAPFYQRGAVGIDNKGLLEVRNTEGLDLQQVAQLKRLVGADNQARTQLYREVAAALGIDATQVGKVQEIFAGEWQSKAPAGYWIQDAGGAWRQK